MRRPHVDAPSLASACAAARAALRGWGLLLVPAVLYVGAFAGITCSNDGSHFSLVRALVETGSPVIDPYAAMTEGIDLSVHGGHLYSDRPPGSAVLASAFYATGLALPPFWNDAPSTWDRANPFLSWVLLAPATAAWLAAWLLWRFQRRLGVRPWLALAGCATLLLGTTLWKYGTALFSHAFAACLLLAAVYVLVSVREWSARAGLLAGVLLGAAAAVEYQNAAFIGIALAWLAWARRPRFRAAMGLALGLAVTILPLLAYFKACFGGWLTTSYAVRMLDPWSRDVGTTFAGNLAEGLTGLLWRNERSTGWLVRMPVLVFGLAGYALAVKARHRELLLPLTALVFFVLLFSTHVTYHTNTGDARYLAPYLPLALLPATLVVERAFGRARWLGTVAASTFGVLALLGALGTISVLAHSYGTPDVRVPYPVLSWWSDPGADLASAFRNFGNVAPFLITYAFVAAVHVSVVAVKAGLSESNGRPA